jgi:hypothetical protein
MAKKEARKRAPTTPTGDRHAMRWTSTLFSLALGMTCLGCGSPTREAAAEEHVTRAVDELALNRRVFAEEHLETALRLDPSSARAGALLQLVRPPGADALTERLVSLADDPRPAELSVMVR